MRSLFTLIVLGGVASAQPAPPDSQAIALFKEGLALLDGNQAAAACEKFEASLTFEPDAAGPMLNLGLCNEQLDKLATALRWFRRVETRAAELQITDAETAAKAKSTALAAKVPTIKITFSQPQPHGSAVAVDGRKLEDFDLARFEVDAGHHVVELVGFDSATREIDIADGDAKTIELVVPLPPPPPPQAAKNQYTYVDRSTDQRRLAYIVGGVGAGLLIGDGVLLVVAKHEFDATDHPDTRESWRNVARYGGTSFFILGAGAVAGAAWLYFRAPSHDHVEQTVIAPTIDRGHVGLAFSRTF